MVEAATHGDCNTSHSRNVRSKNSSGNSLPCVQVENTEAPSNHKEAETAREIATLVNTSNLNANVKRDLSSNASIRVRSVDAALTNSPTNCRMEFAKVRVVANKARPVAPMTTATIRFEP